MEAEEDEDFDFEDEYLDEEVWPSFRERWEVWEVKEYSWRSMNEEV